MGRKWSFPLLGEIALILDGMAQFPSFFNGNVDRHRQKYFPRIHSSAVDEMGSTKHSHDHHPLPPYHHTSHVLVESAKTLRANGRLRKCIPCYGYGDRERKVFYTNRYKSPLSAFFAHIPYPQHEQGFLTYCL